MSRTQAAFDADALRAGLDAEGPLTLGVEEELMLMHPETFELAPVAASVLERLEGDRRFKPELAAAQIELLTDPCRDAGDVLESLRLARRDLAAASSGLAVPAGAGAHPTARAPAVLSDDPRYDPTRREYGPIAGRQLVFGLHVHVRLSGVDRALAVYNALRSYLPLIAALGANAPLYEGEEAGLASVRPKLAGLLPRQGVPPPFGSFQELSDSLEWGLRSGAMAFLGSWWWELRIHPVYGTIEVRVPDQQTRARESAALAAVVHCLVAWLADRHDDGELLPVHPTWRIEENRWSACRYGAEGTFADLVSGDRRSSAEEIVALLDSLDAYSERLGAADGLADARRLLAEGGAKRQLEAARTGGAGGACRYLAGALLAG